jgi:hypothetical protein
VKLTSSAIAVRNRTHTREVRANRMRVIDTPENSWVRRGGVAVADEGGRE